MQSVRSIDRQNQQKNNLFSRQTKNPFIILVISDDAQQTGEFLFHVPKMSLTDVTVFFSNFAQFDICSNAALVLMHGIQIALLLFTIRNERNKESLAYKFELVLLTSESLSEWLVFARTIDTDFESVCIWKLDDSIHTIGETMEYIKKLKMFRCTGDVEMYIGRHLLTKKLVILKEIQPNLLDDGIPASAIR